VRKKLYLTTVGNSDDLFGLSIRTRIRTFYHDDFNANMLYTEYGIPPLPSTLFKAPRLPTPKSSKPHQQAPKTSRPQDPKAQHLSISILHNKNTPSPKHHAAPKMPRGKATQTVLASRTELSKYPRAGRRDLFPLGQSQCPILVHKSHALYLPAFASETPPYRTARLTLARVWHLIM